MTRQESVMFPEAPSSRFAAEKCEKPVADLFGHRQHAVELCRSELLLPCEHADVTPQIMKLCIAHRHAKVLSNDILDIMRLVEDHRGVLGNDGSVILLFYRKIG